ncbi:hypothetical protein K443DRAFT_102742, partial [Laccaria amethystina LaAM-08-1]
ATLGELTSSGKFHSSTATLKPFTKALTRFSPTMTLSISATTYHRISLRVNFGP